MASFGNAAASKPRGLRLGLGIELRSAKGQAHNLFWIPIQLPNFCARQAQPMGSPPELACKVPSIALPPPVQMLAFFCKRSKRNASVYCAFADEGLKKPNQYGASLPLA